MFQQVKSMKDNVFLNDDVLIFKKVFLVFLLVTGAYSNTSSK